MLGTTEGETVESFFQKIKLTDHASKFSSWEELFTTKTRVRATLSMPLLCCLTTTVVSSSSSLFVCVVGRRCERRASRSRRTDGSSCRGWRSTGRESIRAPASTSSTTRRAPGSRELSHQVLAVPDELH